MIGQHLLVVVDMKVHVRKITIHIFRKRYLPDLLKPFRSLKDGIINTRRFWMFSGRSINIATDGSLLYFVKVFLFNLVKVSAGTIQNASYRDGCGRDELLCPAIASRNNSILLCPDIHDFSPWCVLVDVMKLNLRETSNPLSQSR